MLSTSPWGFPVFVIGVADWGDMIEIAVETLLEVGCCPRCGHADATVKERRCVR